MPSALLPTAAALSVCAVAERNSDEDDLSSGDGREEGCHALCGGEAGEGEKESRLKCAVVSGVESNAEDEEKSVVSRSERERASEVPASSQGSKAAASGASTPSQQGRFARKVAAVKALLTASVSDAFFFSLLGVSSQEGDEDDGSFAYFEELHLTSEEVDLLRQDEASLSSALLEALEPSEASCVCALARRLAGMYCRNFKSLYTPGLLFMAAFLCRRWGSATSLSRMVEALRGLWLLVHLPLCEASESPPKSSASLSPRHRRDELKTVMTTQCSERPACSPSPAFRAAIFFQHRSFLQNHIAKPSSRVAETSCGVQKSSFKAEGRTLEHRVSDEAQRSLPEEPTAASFSHVSSNSSVSDREEEQRQQHRQLQQLRHHEKEIEETKEKEKLEEEQHEEEELEEVELSSQSSVGGEGAVPTVGGVSSSSVLTAAVPSAGGLPAAERNVRCTSLDTVASRILQGEVDQEELQKLLIAQARLKRGVSRQLRTLLSLHFPDVLHILDVLGVEAFDAVGDFLMTGFASWCYSDRSGLSSQSADSRLSLEEREAAVETLWKFLALFGEPRAYVQLTVRCMQTGMWSLGGLEEELSVLFCSVFISLSLFFVAAAMIGRKEEALKRASSAEEAVAVLRISHLVTDMTVAASEGALKEASSYGSCQARRLWFEAAALGHRTLVSFADPRFAEADDETDGKEVPLLDAETLAASAPRRALLRFKMEQLRAELERRRSIQASGSVSRSVSTSSEKANLAAQREPSNWVEQLLPLQPGVALALPGLFLSSASKEGDSEETVVLAAVEAFGAQAEEAGEVCIVDCRSFDQVEATGNRRLQHQSLALDGDAIIQLLSKEERTEAEETSLASILLPVMQLRGKRCVALLGADTEVLSPKSNSGDSALHLPLIEDDPVELLFKWLLKHRFPNVAVLGGGWTGIVLDSPCLLSTDVELLKNQITETVGAFCCGAAALEEALDRHGLSEQAFVGDDFEASQAGSAGAANVAAAAIQEWTQKARKKAASFISSEKTQNLSKKWQEALRASKETSREVGSSLKDAVFHSIGRPSGPVPPPAFGGDSSSEGKVVREPTVRSNLKEVDTGGATSEQCLNNKAQSVRLQAAQVRAVAANFWSSFLKRPSSEESKSTADSTSRQETFDEQTQDRTYEVKEQNAESSSEKKSTNKSSSPCSESASAAASSDCTDTAESSGAAVSSCSVSSRREVESPPRSLQSLIAGRLEEARRSSSLTLSSWSETLKSISLARRGKHEAEEEESTLRPLDSDTRHANSTSSSLREASESRNSSGPREAIDVVLRQQLLSAEDSPPGAIDFCSVELHDQGETNSCGARVEAVGEAQDIISLMRQVQNFIEEVQSLEKGAVADLAEIQRHVGDIQVFEAVKVRRDSNARWPLFAEGWRRGGSGTRGPLRWIVLTLNQLVVVEPGEDNLAAQEDRSSSPSSLTNATDGRAALPRGGSEGSVSSAAEAQNAQSEERLFLSKRRHTTAASSSGASPASSAPWGSALKSLQSLQEKARGALAMASGDGGNGGVHGCFGTLSGVVSVAGKERLTVTVKSNHRLSAIRGVTLSSKNRLEMVLSFKNGRKNVYHVLARDALVDEMKARSASLNIEAPSEGEAES